MSETFASTTVPFGRWYPYEVQNIQLPSDNKYFVTIIYSTHNVSTPKDRYLHHWFHNHPALMQVAQQTHFREVSVNDPIYSSYLGQAVPNPPAILITAPPQPGEGYFGRVVYCAYGDYLSTNPNTIARELQVVFHQQQYADMYAQQTIQPIPPVIPDIPPESTVLSTDANVLFAGGAGLVLLYLFMTGRRRR